MPEQIYLLHTKDELNSKAPAQRLKELLKNLFGEAVICKTQQVIKETPEYIRRAIEHIDKQRDPGTLKTVNATGGLKLMFAGLLPFISRADFEVIYLEINKKWIRLIADEVAPTQVRGEILDDVHECASDIPVIDLANTQAGNDVSLIWKADPLFGLPVEDIVAIIRRGITAGWNWAEIVSSYPELRSASSGAGRVFEHIFAAILKQFQRYATQGCMNAKLVRKSQLGETKEEVDILYNTGRKVICFDLTLRPISSKVENEVSHIDQLAKLSSNVHNLGGIGAQGVLVRPNWNGVDPSMKNLARASKVVIWDSESFGDLLGAISTLLEEELPESLEPIQALFARQQMEGRRLFCSPAKLPLLADGSTPVNEVNSIPGVLNLLPYISSVSVGKEPRPILLQVFPSVFMLQVHDTQLKSLNAGKPRELSIGTLKFKVLSFKKFPKTALIVFQNDPKTVKFAEIHEAMRWRGGKPPRIQVY